MPAPQRSISVRGPRFWRQGEETMFAFHYDTFTQDGPRVATEADIEAHPAPYEAFLTETPPPPLAPLVTFETPPDAEIPADVGSVAKPRGPRKED